MNHVQEMWRQHVNHSSVFGADKPVLFVLKGFERDFFQNVPAEKLLSIGLDVSIQELKEAKAQLLPEVFQKIGSVAKERMYWCTFEEMITLDAEILSLYFQMIILKNNLYHQTFPCLYSIEKAEELYQKHFALEEWTGENTPELDAIQDYYGDLKLVKGIFYVTYAMETEDRDFYVHPGRKLRETVQSAYDEAYLELSEEEDAFLAFIDEVVHGRLEKREVHITYSGELTAFPNHYVKRLELLQWLYGDRYSFVLANKRTESKRVNEEEYLRILKQYWGFSSFRKLKMYKNVNHPEKYKEVVEISQSQIIDDIVQQAEKARKGEEYKDVFVTSPTGAGKSIMFQIPAIYLAEKYDLLTIIISPLIGLMTDQVQGLHSKNVHFSATINSEITPVEKMDIIEKVKSGQISILYISPETLLSRSDISMLIGERKVGLFVIDEAHIVTTWGKAFRSDYWYLGGYLQKLRKERQFPIATFTATAIYGGIEDMYAETRDSLNMINPISYFGYVKRDDIEIRICQKEMDQKYSEYLKDKFDILTYRLETFLKRGHKTLVYFPTISLIGQYLSYVKLYAPPDLCNQLVWYHGRLDKEKKQAHYLKFKNNEALIMLATKAFGMGIDIPDIHTVYHFAPTGNVCDYIQEIGRAARSLERGYAYFDFLPKDFGHVNRLHGISTLRKHQLIQVMDKVLKLAEKGKDGLPVRNMLVNSDDFRYIFESGRDVDQVEDVDNKLKTALLVIEKDFKSKLNYSPIVARPRSLFADEYFLVNSVIEERLIQKYGKYFIKMPYDDSKKGLFKCHLKRLWEDHYKEMSFPQFKYLFHTKDPGLNLFFLGEIESVLVIHLQVKNHISKLKSELHNITNSLAEVFGMYAKTGEFFKAENLARELRKRLRKDKYTCINLATVTLISAMSWDRLNRQGRNFYNSFILYDEVRGYRLTNSGFSSFFTWIENYMDRILSDHLISRIDQDRVELYLPRGNRNEIERTFVLLGMAEAMGLLVYRVTGGENPEIFIRINSFLQLKRAAGDPQNYENRVLNNVKERHATSVEMLKYLFQKEVSTEEFWDLIEDYFLGKLPEPVKANLKHWNMQGA